MSHWHVSMVTQALSRQDSSGRGLENMTCRMQAANTLSHNVVGKGCMHLHRFMTGRCLECAGQPEREEGLQDSPRLLLGAPGCAVVAVQHPCELHDGGIPGQIRELLPEEGST